MLTDTDFAEFLSTFAVFLESSRRLEEISQRTNAEVDELLRRTQHVYTANLALNRSAEESLKRFALAHPEWFQGKKSLTVAQGTIAKRQTCAIQCEDPERTVALI